MDDNNEVDRTLWCGNLSDEVTEELLYELFLQAGPLEKLKLVTDRETNKPKYAFVTFNHAESVPYTIELMNSTEIYGKPLRLQTRPGSSHNQSGNHTPASPGMQHGERFRDRDGERFCDGDRYRDGERYRDSERFRDGDRYRDRSEISRTMSAPDHIQRYASDANSRMAQLNQLGAGLANPLAAQSMMSPGGNYPTKEAQRQRAYNQQQLLGQQQQQQLEMQQRYDWIMLQQQQQTGRRRQPRWY